jgi:hypothetical protein
MWDRSVVPDPAQGQGRGVAHATFLVAEGVDQRVEGVRVPDAAQCICRAVANCLIFVRHVAFRNQLLEEMKCREIRIQ